MDVRTGLSVKGVRALIVDMVKTELNAKTNSAPQTTEGSRLRVYHRRITSIYGITAIAGAIPNPQLAPNAAANPGLMAPPSFSFLEAFYAFLRDERGLSKASFRIYDYSLRLLQSYLDRIGVIDIKELSPPILSSFVIDTKDRFGKASLSRVLCPIRVMLRYLYRERILERDLSGVVELMPHLRSVRRSLRRHSRRRSG